MNKKNLIVTCAGDNSLHKEWLKGEDPSFDLIIIYYGDTKAVEYIKDCNFIVQRKGFKYRLIEFFLSNYWENIKDYEYISFADDDLSCDSKCFNNLFKVMKEYDLWVAQPALTNDSYTNHQEVLQDQSCKLRYSSFVEIMVPTFKKIVLENIKHTIIDTDSGWGLEFLWFDMLGCQKNKFAIIDETPIKHTKPFTGYPQGVNPTLDWQKTAHRFVHYNHGKQIFGKVLK